MLTVKSQFLTVAKWIEGYGPVITIRSGFHKIVIIGRHKVSSIAFRTI